MKIEINESVLIEEIAQKTAKLVIRKIATLSENKGPDFLSRKEAVEYMNLSLVSLDRLIKDKKINSYRPTNDRVLFLKDELRSYILSCKADL